MGKVQGEDCIKEELENVYDSQKCNIWMKDFKIWNKTIAEKYRLTEKYHVEMKMKWFWKLHYYIWKIVKNT